MNTDILITRTFTDGRPQQVMKFQPESKYRDPHAWPPDGTDAMNFAALLFCVPMQEPGYDAWTAVERLGLARHFVDVTPAAQPDYGEGDNCPYCNGTFHYPPVDNCMCHFAPPCSACVENALECDKCGNTDLTRQPPKEPDLMAPAPQPEPIQP